MTSPISIRAYARHRGCHKSSVEEAITRGRLVRSVVRDAAGTPKIRSAATADVEWQGSTRAEHVPISITSRKAAGSAAAVSRRLAARVRVFAEDDLQALLHLVPDFVAGASAQLEAAGTPPTEAAVLRALNLQDLENDDAGLDAYCALHELTGAGPADPKKTARQAGADAVAATLARPQIEAGSDGSEGPG